MLSVTPKDSSGEAGGGADAAVQPPPIVAFFQRSGSGSSARVHPAPAADADDTKVQQQKQQQQQQQAEPQPPARPRSGARRSSSQRSRRTNSSGKVSRRQSGPLLSASTSAPRQLPAPVFPHDTSSSSSTDENTAVLKLQSSTPGRTTVSDDEAKGAGAGPTPVAPRVRKAHLQQAYSRALSLKQQCEKVRAEYYSTADPVSKQAILQHYRLLKQQYHTAHDEYMHLRDARLQAKTQALAGKEDDGSQQFISRQRMFDRSSSSSPIKGITAGQLQRLPHISASRGYIGEHGLPIPTVLVSQKTLHSADSDREEEEQEKGKRAIGKDTNLELEYRAFHITPDFDPRKPPHSDMQSLSVEQQLVAFDSLKSGIFTYSFFVLTARVRYAYFFLLVTALTFCSQLGFVFSVFFSVLLPEARDDEHWPLRAAFMLPAAPLIFIMGSWFNDTLLYLFRGAVDRALLRDLRLRMAAFLHVCWYWDAIVSCSREEMAFCRYRGPVVNRRTMQVVDSTVLFLFEFIPLVGFCVGGTREGSLTGAVAGYFTFALSAAGCLGVIFLLLVIITTTVPRFYVTDQLLHEVSPLSTSIWVVPQVSSSLAVRVMNLGRHLLPAEYWELGSRRYRNKFVQDLADAPKTTYRTCKSYMRAYAKRVPWSVRLLLDVVLYATFCLLVAFDLMHFGVGWLLLSITVHLMGMKLKEALGPKYIGRAFGAFLAFFTVFGCFLFIFAASNLQPSSHLNLGPPPPTAVQTTQLAPRIEFTASAKDVVYPVCNHVWGGLDVLDLSILANLAYATDDTFHQQMTSAFVNTSMEQWTLVHSQPQGRVLHFKEIFFSATNLTVVTIRGTSTSQEIYQDAHLYSSISLLQFISRFVPIKGVLPDPLIQNLLYIMSLPNLSGPPAYEAVLEHVRAAKAAGKNVLLTGHSLGGAISGITAAQTETTAVTFSPPGLYFVESSVGATTSLLRRYVTAVVPELDVVPKVDRQVGNVQYIDCYHLAPKCHSIDVTMCELQRTCGDRRQRQFSDYCAEYYSHE